MRKLLLGPGPNQFPKRAEQANRRHPQKEEMGVVILVGSFHPFDHPVSFSEARVQADQALGCHKSTLDSGQQFVQ